MTDKGLKAAAERGAARRVKLNMHAPGNDDAAPKCGNCVYWRARMEGGREGTCHFAPPTPMIVGMSMPAGGPKLQGISQQAPQPIVGSQFPPIGESGWCGCHRMKPA